MDQATRKSGTSDSPVLGNNSRLVRHRKTLQDLWASLPSSHQAILDHFLKKLTMQELHRLQERLRTVGNHQLSRFTSMLCNASSEQFLRYLRFFTAPPYHWENDSPTSGMPSAAIIVHNAARLGNDNTPLSGAIIRSSNMYRVPQELFDMVLNDLFRTVFVPGTLHPGAFPFFDGPDCFADKSFNLNKSRTFRSLDIVRYNRYKDAYWSQNTWIIGQGTSGYTVDFLEHIPVPTYFKLRSIHLKFTTQDFLDGMPECYVNENRSLLDNLEDWLEHCGRANVELGMLWWEKFSILASLYLEWATLDFTEAFSMDGRYMGVETARTLQPFSHGLPKLDILAPTELLCQQIRDAIVAKNQ